MIISQNVIWAHGSCGLILSKIDDSPAKNTNEVGKRNMEHKSHTIRKLFASTSELQEVDG